MQSDDIVQGQRRASSQEWRSLDGEEHSPEPSLGGERGSRLRGEARVESPRVPEAQSSEVSGPVTGWAREIQTHEHWAVGLWPTGGPRVPHTRPCP